MKKIILILISAGLLIMLIFFLCGFHFSATYGIGRDISLNKINQINCVWKSDGGKEIAGTDGFHKENCEVRGDTLFLFGVPVAKAKRLVYRYIAHDYELTIQNFNGQEKGVYVSK